MTGRRASLPGADELFRSTAPLLPGPGAASAPAAAPSPAPGAQPAPEADLAPPAAAHQPAAEPGEDDDAGEYPPPSPLRRRPRTTADRRPSGREKHDEKITVYCSAEELLDIERARLVLRGDHGLAVDRGRIVREALALVLAEFEQKGEQSTLVRRLRGR